MDQPRNFQSIIMALQNFWAEQGCLIWQPYYSQVGAGTMNPATALRVLGPEPWRVGYVEPSIRPDDGRYGENPNRMQMHYQFQVILKPDPGNPQEIYLRSLEALGIDPRLHDIRFVEDNWESPALGAWGLGWEVWLDGQEITQFTYFQQSGGQLLDPVSVEITYGLERIAIALQNVSSFRDIAWSSTLTDGDVNLQAEQEHCKYYFEIADVPRLRQMYDLYDAEAQACLEQKLVLPAHDYVLKCSHTFNVLDTRGAIGVTERQAYFARMRDLSRRVAEAYVEQRQRLEYPWLNDSSPEQAIRQGAPKSPEFQIPSPLSPNPFLLEIGTEELPAGDLDVALEQLRREVPALLNNLRLEHDQISVLGTPRRLVAWVEALAPRQLQGLRGALQRRLRVAPKMQGGGQIAQRIVERMQAAQRSGMLESALGSAQAAVGIAQRGKRQRQIAQSGGLLVLDVEYLSAPWRRPGLPASGDGFLQVLAGRGELAGQEQGTAEEKMPQDEKRSRLMLRRTHQTLLGEIPALGEVGARDLVGADSGEHREDLRRRPQLVTQFKRCIERVAAGWR